jgi:lipoate-protein ligase A
VTFEVDRRRESAATFHDRQPGEPFPRAVWVAEPTGRALVLGSGQRDDVVDPAATIEVVRRRSGGGAVLVAPGAQLWVDVLLPAGDRRWQDDVGRSVLWLGDVWVAALDQVGITARRHEGAMVRTRWSPLVCFAGLGPGEVVGPAGEKLVGISQRRTRAGARFQCSVPLLPWDPGAVVALLALSPADRARAAADLIGAVGHVPVTHDALLDAFLAHLG